MHIYPPITDGTSRRRGISTLASALILATGGTLALSQAQAEESFRPEASEAFVQALTSDAQRGQENALISVTYDLMQWHDNEKNPPSSQQVLIDEQTVILRDDGRHGDTKSGDGIFSAFVEFDFDTLLFKRKRIERLTDTLGDKAIPSRFENRQLIGSEKIMPPNDSFPVILPVAPEESLQRKGSIATLSDDVQHSPSPIMLEENLAVAIQLGKPIPIFPIGISATIETEKSLLIRDPTVVQDSSRTFNVCTDSGNPNGVWTFKHLVTEMANTAQTGITPEAFVRMWLAQWETSQNVNGWNVEERHAGIRNRIIDRWEQDSGGAEEPLDLDKAPFQLLAIVNRVDLRENLVYGGGSGGEGRFVFQVMDMNQGCTPMQFTVIFEYGVEAQSCSAVKNWGQRWADLSDMALGSAVYNTALENITESFVQAKAAPSKPNGSALNQLRTNEIALDSPWELREFVIADAGWNEHLLKPKTVALTPDTSLNNTSVLNDFFVSGIQNVPLHFPTTADPFRGGASTVPDPSFFWSAPDFSSTLSEVDRRHRFSLNTCNGCHAGETKTFFTHIKPGTIPAELSGFLTGIDVPDPAPSANIMITRHFNDLERRSVDLDGLVNSSCFAQLVRPTLKAPH